MRVADTGIYKTMGACILKTMVGCMSLKRTRLAFDVTSILYTTAGVLEARGLWPADVLCSKVKFGCYIWVAILLGNLRRIPAFAIPWELLRNLVSRAAAWCLD